MKNYNMWPKAHKESYNYTHREDKRNNSGFTPSIHQKMSLPDKHILAQVLRSET